MKYKNMYYDIPEVLGYPNMAAVRAAGIKNPGKAARSAIVASHQANRRKRKEEFEKKRPQAVVKATSDSLEAQARAKLKSLANKEKHYHRRHSGVPVMGPEDSQQSKSLKKRIADAMFRES